MLQELTLLDSGIVGPNFELRHTLYVHSPTPCLNHQQSPSKPTVTVHLSSPLEIFLLRRARRLVIRPSMSLAAKIAFTTDLLFRCLALLDRTVRGPNPMVFMGWSER